MSTILGVLLTVLCDAAEAALIVVAVSVFLGIAAVTVLDWWDERQANRHLHLDGTQRACDTCRGRR